MADYNPAPAPGDYAQPYGPDTNALVNYLIQSGMGGLVGLLPTLTPASSDLALGLAPLGEDLGTTGATNWVSDLISLTADPMVGLYGGAGAFAPDAFEPTRTYTPVDLPGARQLNELAANQNSLEGYIARALLGDTVDGTPLTVSQIRADLERLAKEHEGKTLEELVAIDPRLAVLSQIPIKEFTDPDTQKVISTGRDWDWVEKIAGDLYDLYQSDPVPGTSAAVLGANGEVITPARTLEYVTDADGNQVLVEVKETPSEQAEHFRDLGIPLPTEEFTPDYLLGEEWQQSRDAFEATYGNDEVLQALIDEEMARFPTNDVGMPGLGAAGLAPYMSPELADQVTAATSAGGVGSTGSEGIGGNFGLRTALSGLNLTGGTPAPTPQPPDFWNGTPAAGTTTGVQGQINSRNAAPGIAQMVQYLLQSGVPQSGTTPPGTPSPVPGYGAPPVGDTYLPAGATQPTLSISNPQFAYPPGATPQPTLSISNPQFAWPTTQPAAAAQPAANLQQPTTGTTLPPIAPASTTGTTTTAPSQQPTTGTTLPAGGSAADRSQAELAAATQQMMQYLLQSGVPGWSVPGQHVFPRNSPADLEARWGPNAQLPSQVSSPGEPMAMIGEILRRSAPLSREDQAAYDYLEAHKPTSDTARLDVLGGLFPTNGGGQTAADGAPQFTWNSGGGSVGNLGGGIQVNPTVAADAGAGDRETPWWKRYQDASLRFITENADYWRDQQPTRANRNRVSDNEAERFRTENRYRARQSREREQVYGEEYGRALARSRALQRAGITPTSLVLAQRNQVLSQAGLRP